MKLCWLILLAFNAAAAQLISAPVTINTPPVIASGTIDAPVTATATIERGAATVTVEKGAASATGNLTIHAPMTVEKGAAQTQINAEKDSVAHTEINAPVNFIWPSGTPAVVIYIGGKDAATIDALRKAGEDVGFFAQYWREIIAALVVVIAALWIERRRLVRAIG